MDEESLTKPVIVWKKEHENILIEWADKAMCYSWLHSKSYNLYKLLDIWFTVPVIIVSTITGTANFAQDRIPMQYADIYVMIIGAANIIVGIVTTIKQFLKIKFVSIGTVRFTVRINLLRSTDNMMLL